MEWKKLVNSSPVAEWKKLGNIMKGKRTTMFVSGFAFALIACTAYMAFSSPGKIMTNPMGRSQTWFPAFLTRSNSSQSVSIFSFIFPNSNSSSSSAKLDDHENTFKGNDDPNNVIAKTPNEENQQTKASHEENQQKEVPKGKRTVPNVQKPDSRNKNGPKRRENQKGSPINNEQTNKSSTQGSAVLPSSPSAIFANKNGSDSFNLTATLSEKNATSANGKGTDLNVTASMVNTTRSEQGNSTSSSEQSTGSFAGRKQCDIFNGRWVRDDSYPYYPAGSCPHIDESFNCFRNRRPDNEYEKWRWQPKECNIPRLNATDMLERLRGKRLVFVGDSLNRNMWESLVCILRYAVPNKKRVYEISGRQEFKTEGFYAFRYKDYNCSVEFVRSPFLVQEWEIPDVNGTTKETLRLDIIERSASKYKDANIVVFNTGHWWTHEKTSKGKDYYQEGDHVYSELNVIEAYRKALRTWAKWVDRNINSKKTQVFFRGYSASHFSGGQWNSGGQCHTESQPIFNESYLITYPPKMNVLESVLKEMKTPVVYLNITRMTDYRKDGHPSLYRKQYLSQEERMAPDRYQDCSHWCLPGVPDTWNELLYASLLSRGIGVWRT